jgi:RNA polymerase sigma factor (sigma-70 family)
MIDTNRSMNPKTPPNEDARWIVMIKEGGRQEGIALNEIFDRYKGLVITYLQGYAGRKEDAEDVLQDALLVLSIDVPSGKFRAGSAIKDYLMAIVRHLWINQLRKVGRQQTTIETLLAEEAAATLQWSDAPKELELLRDPKQRALLRTIGKLFQGCLAVLKMFYWYAWPYRKIANLLGYPSEASVKLKKLRCVDELKRFLEKHPSLKAFLREG